MINMRISLPICTALSAALLLSACGKQEAVKDMPSSEELAKQAEAAAKAIRDQEDVAASADSSAVDTSNMISHANALRGFTILVPKSWSANVEASDENGQVFSNAGTGVTLTVGWIENLNDAELLAAVKKLEDTGEGVTGDYVNENEYRAAGVIGEGKKTAQRILRKPDGSMVRAMIDYPSARAEALDPLATRILDSLTLK